MFEALFIVACAVIFFLFRQPSDELDQTHEATNSNPRLTFDKKGFLIRSPSSKLLFLDFDGVLHPYETGGFDHLVKFEEIMREFPEVDICFSTDWRLFHSFDSLICFFSPDIRARIIGYTGEHSNSITGYERYDEILQFLRDYSISPRYIALDDRSELFPSGFDNLVLTNKKSGLAPDSENLLHQKLSSLV